MLVKQWCVYILQCADGTLYTGITNNLKSRVQKHNKGVASKYTRVRLPVKVVYTEKCEDRSQASKRELAIKKLSKEEKLKLVLQTS